MIAPRKLAISPISPNYNKEALTQVDKVFVNDKHLPNCVAYDMDAGWAFAKEGGKWMPRQHGEITVTMK